MYFGRGDYPRYVSEGLTFTTLKHDGVHADVFRAAGQGLAQGGEAAMLSATLHAELPYEAKGAVSPYEVAVTYGELGDRVDALAWLHRAVNAHDDEVLGALTQPAFRFLYPDPRFGFVRATITGRAG